MKVKHKNITFTTENLVDSIYHPQPASKMLPDWYKKMPSYLEGGKAPSKGYGGTNGTIKKCIPVFDAMTAGYIIVTNTDLHIKSEDGAPYYRWPSGDGVAFHPLEQAKHHPLADGFAFPKWINSWSVETPKGYSSFFLQPMHRESPFIALAGIIDTDTYTPPGNIIFTLANKNFEGLIPAGTPIVQVIPFKRDSWKMSLGGEENLKKKWRDNALLRSRFHEGYKTFFWTKKEYN
jgi:hypothetical protein